MMKLYLMSLVTAHMTLVMANVASFFALIYYEKWYIAAPLCSFIVWVTFARVTCPLTIWENKIREKMGLPTIGGFIGHYILRKKTKNATTKYRI